MASSFSTRLRIDLPADSDTGWGTIMRTDLGTLLEEAIAGYSSIATANANVTLTTNNGATDQARQMMLQFTGVLTANRNIVVPTSSKLYFIDNACTGAFSLVVKTSAGSGVTIPNGSKAIVYCDGTNVVDAHSWLSALTVAGALSVGGAATITGALTPQALVDISGAGAGQVKFPATQNASADANTLDDYEEGTWTPAITFATPGNLSVAYTTRSGTYTKVGRLVTVSFTIVTSTFTHTTASGSLSVTGLPFTVSNSTGYSPTGALWWAGITKASYTHVIARGILNTTTVDFLASGSGVAASNIAAADTPTGGTLTLRGTITYEV